MKSRIHFNTINYIVLITITLVSIFIINIAGPRHPRKVIVEGDGCGHFDYLPALLIYHSTDFKPVFEKEKTLHDKSYMGHYFHEVNGVTINKYTSGTALMILPFYLLAWILSFLFGFPADGFGIFFQYSAVFAGAVWLLTGLIYFMKLLELYKVNRITALLLSLLLLTGTNLFFYAFIAPAFSHVYSFAVYTMLLYHTKKYFQQPGPGNLYLSALLYGVMILIRPVNAIALFTLPAMADSVKNLKQGLNFLFKPKRIVTLILVTLAAVSPQLIIYYLQTGKIWFNGYVNEGFYFFHPQIINFLFSFRKGWFVYTPLMLFLFPAMYSFYRSNRSGFWVITLFFLFQIYLFSAWWNWFYGDSFGMRPMIDYYPLYFLIISLFFNSLRKRKQIITVGTISIFFVFLNLFQTYQYAEGILHPDSMNAAAYRYIFLKGSKKYKNIIGACDESYYGKLSGKPFLKTRYTRDGRAIGWSEARVETDDPAGVAGKVAVVNQRYRFSPTYVQYLPDSMAGKADIYVVFKAEYYEPIENEAETSRFVVNILDKSGKINRFYKTFPLKRLPDRKKGIWRKAHVGFKLPPLTKEDKVVKYYIWYRGKHLMYLNNLELDFFTIER